MLLGSGAYGKVSKVQKYGFSFALKTCTFTDDIDDIAQVLACLREDMLTNVKHPYIIETFWSRFLPNKFQKAMEIGEPVYEARADRLMHDIGQALCFLHTNGFIHRDVKPANIVRVNNVYKLIDFGLCRKGKCKTSMTGYTITRFFRPPELLKCDENEDSFYDGRVDMYSLGVTAWWLQYKKPLFVGNVEEILSAFSKFQPSGLFTHLICTYEKRFTSAQFLEYYNIAQTPGVFEEKKVKKRPTDVQKFVEAMCEGNVEKAWALSNGNLSDMYKKLI